MLKKRYIIIFTLLLILYASCTEKRSGFSNNYINEEFLITQESEELTYETVIIDPARLAAIEAAASIAASMTNYQLASQVLLTGLDSNNFLSTEMRNMLSEIPVGGIMFYRHNLASEKHNVCSFLEESTLIVLKNTGISPFIAVDHEGGLVHRFGQGVSRLPSAYYFWQLAQAEGTEVALIRLTELVTQSAMEIRGLGITMNLAPIAEVLTDENKIFLDTRSYGPDPIFVEMAASAFINAMDSAGISSVLKHFPGNSAEDPHFRESIINWNYNELLSMTQPFRSIIHKLNPPAIMISHSIVEAIDPENNASLSPLVINWLRQDFGFQGIVMADDFRMRAVISRGIYTEQAAVIALNAGVDMIMCWPNNIVSVHRAILDALDSNHLPRERLLDAATRILTEKILYGLIP